MQKTKWISIEAGIGAGKSTQIARLQELYSGDPGVVVLPEPVDEWRSKGFLSAMYDGRISRGEFQHCVLQSLAGDLLVALARKPAPRLIVTERSPHANFAVFGRANLTGLGLRLFAHTWERVVAGLDALDVECHFLYLRTSVDTIVHRMRQRGRVEEAGVPREYLLRLHDNHEAFFADLAESSETIDGDRSEDAVWADVKRAVQAFDAKP